MVCDDEFYDELSNFRWGAHKNSSNGNYYVRCQVNKIHIYAHRLITKAPAGYLVDHINGDTLDNRLCNLRVCSASQNSMNKPRGANNTSGYKGVCLHKPSGRWVSSIKTPSGKRVYLGYFDTPEDASEAYKVAAKEYHREFANVM